MLPGPFVGHVGATRTEGGGAGKIAMLFLMRDERTVRAMVEAAKIMNADSGNEYRNLGGNEEVFQGRSKELCEALAAEYETSKQPPKKKKPKFTWGLTRCFQGLSNDDVYQLLTFFIEGRRVWLGIQNVGLVDC